MYFAPLVLLSVNITISKNTLAVELLLLLLTDEGKVASKVSKGSTVCIDANEHAAAACSNRRKKQKEPEPGKIYTNTKFSQYRA